MKTGLKNADVLTFLREKHKLSGLTGHSFVLSFQKNVRLMKQRKEELEEIIKDTPEIIKYREKYLKAQEPFVMKDEKGQMLYDPMPGDPSKMIPRVNPAKADEWKKIEEKLEKDNEKHINVMQKKYDDYNKLMLEDCEIDFYKIPEKALPKNISTDQADMIDFMIDFNMMKKK